MFLILISILILIAENTELNYGTESAETFLNSKCEPGCVFLESKISSETIPLFPKNCSTVCADIFIVGNSDLTEQQLTETFENMKHLIGSLEVLTTNYTSGSFLTGLESVECGSTNRFRRMLDRREIEQFSWTDNRNMLEFGLLNLTSINCFEYKVAANINLKRMNTPNLKFWSTPNDTKVDVTIAPQNGNFCISSQEMMGIMSNENVTISQIEGKYCELPKLVENGKMCNSTFTTSPTNIQEGCTQIFGNLVISPENEHLVSQLKTVEVIFGGLILKNSNLSKIDFFDNLKYIYSLEKSIAAISVEQNPNLSDISFPSLKLAKSNAAYAIIFNNNSQTLSADSTYCDRLQNALNQPGDRPPMFDGKFCSELPKNSPRLSILGFFALVVMINVF
ncbi:Receptor L-domain domain-containing protein [Caenorhabditis elegans]|uniref:Receptor L-domain domain-containing protein n=1 Tax=Caenorhabditis elegans TaxID=6239 RepID=O44600_CAEEL|nr:Receptor L-domain domain-containing protein [Caenorhabditis elegans]CCD69537.1 Receptor L-domain domain-containing protein [Caenorhabditis elegans]|eukprot:NP_503645.1 Insulin/EGF-Receptor L Domain protein [Caenorhabditis elegans]